MDPALVFAQLLALAPNFRVTVEFTSMGRVLMWHATPRGSLVEQSAGLPFPAGSPFEVRFATLLQQALARLQPAG